MFRRRVSANWRRALLLLVAGLAACANPTPQESYKKALAAIDEGDYRTATIHLKNVVQGDAENLDALVLLADVGLAQGDAETAVLRYRRALNRGATETQVRIGLLESLLEIGSYRQALDELDDALADSAAKTAELLSLRGRANSSLGRFVDAESDFRDAIKLKPEGPNAHLYLAEMLFRMERTPEAEAEIFRALELDPNHPAPVLWQAQRDSSDDDEIAAETGFREAIRIAEKRYDENRFIEQRHYFKIWSAALYQLADLQINQDKPDEAFETVAELVRIWPNNPFQKFLRARLATLSEDFDTAKQLLQDVLSAEPDFQPAQRLLGVIYGLEGNLDLAEMYLRPYVQNHPDDQFARQVLVQVRVGQNQPEEALALLEAADGEINPDARRNLLALAGRATLEAGNQELALQYFGRGAADFPSDQRFEIGQALALLADGQLAEAIELLEKIDESENRSQKSAVLVIAYLREGEIQKALSLAKLIAAENPDDVWAHNLLTTVYLAAGDAVKARAQVEYALQADTGNVYALANLARIEQRQGNGAAAEKALEQILERDNENEWARVNLARLELGRGRLEKAIALVRPIEEHSTDARLLVAAIEFDRGNTREARIIADEVIRSAPATASGYALLGLIDLEEQAYDSAVRNFETATRIEPSTFLFQLNLARGYLATGDQEGARSTIDNLRDINPTPPQLAVMEITLFTRDGDYVRAERLLENLEKSEFDPTLRLILLAELLEAQKRHADAIEAYSAAYSKRPSQRLAVRILRAGWAADLAQPPEPARNWVTLNPNDAVTLKALASWHLGRNELKMAQHYLERVVNIDNKDPMALNDLAWIYHQNADERALRTAERAYALKPRNAAIADTLGWIQLEAGNIKPALKLLETAGQSEPQNPEIQYHLAVAYLDAGDSESAKNILTDLIQSERTFPSRQAAETALAKL